MTTNIKSLNQSGWKRSSIMNSIALDRNQFSDKYQMTSEKQLSQVKKSKKMALQLKQYKFQPFDLRQLEDNITLIKNNRKFSSLLDTLKLYNTKISQGRQNDIVNYKLYDFFYSTLKICNTKTQTQVDFYLKQVDSWLNTYTHKRQLIIRPNKKRNTKKGQQDLVRQTFKSNLPLQIDQYQRKICSLPLAKTKKLQAMGQYIGSRNNKFNSVQSKIYNDSQESDTEEYVRKIHNSSRQDDIDINQPNLRAYKMQILKMRKVIQERQEKKILQNLRKNQSRIQTQSSNNFYKPLKNKNDIFNKTTNTFTGQHNFDTNSKTFHNQGETQGKFGSKNAILDKQNHKLIVNSTTLGFYQIKKKNINNMLGIKKKQVQFPRFFGTGQTFYPGQNEQLCQVQQGKEQQLPQQIINIQGLNLLRNPFEIAKTKTKKKK